MMMARGDFQNYSSSGRSTILLCRSTIIVKNVGKVAPGSMLSKTLMFVRVIVLLHPNVKGETEDI